MPSSHLAGVLHEQRNDLGIAALHKVVFILLLCINESAPDSVFAKIRFGAGFLFTLCCPILLLYNPIVV